MPTFTAYRAFTIEKGLYLIEPRGGRTYQARARVDGKWIYTGTGTANYLDAETFARKWLRGLRAGREGAETMSQATTAFLESVADAGKREYHAGKWSAIREFWSPGFGRPPITVAEVDTPRLVEFVRWRQSRSERPSANTLHKDLVTVRQILKFAVARGVIPQLPSFPGVQQLGSIVANPQPWLSKPEWQTLMRVAEERITEAANERTRQQRSELRDFCLFMHATGLRVDEAYGLQVRDLTVAYTDAAKPVDGDPVPHDIAQVMAGKQRVPKGRYRMSVTVPYLKISVRSSKTGHRVAHSRVGIYTVYERLIAGKQPSDLVFTARHRDAFRELLIAANLRTNTYGHPRNAKCLRPTAISHWLLDKPTIPLSWLAANCGTSITMLQQFYVRRLGLALDGSAWL